MLASPSFTLHTHTTDTGVQHVCKHFAAIAAELKRQKPFPLPGPFDRTPWESGTYDEWATIVLGMADVCHSFNPNFKRERFLSACGFDA